MSSPLPGGLPDREDDQPDWGGRSVPELVQHLLGTHHPKSRELLAQLLPLSRETAERFHSTQPQLPKVRDSLRLLAEELLEHLRHEEEELFPLLLARDAEGRTLPATWERETELVRFHRQHDHSGELLDDLRIITGDYVLPAGADPLVARLYDGLRELDQDLELHIALEDRWLFSRAD